MSKIIHTDQKEFIKGRKTGGNICIIYDLLICTHCKRIPGLLLLMDFEKAFSGTSGTFIEKVLIASYILDLI